MDLKGERDWSGDSQNSAGLGKLGKKGNLCFHLNASVCLRVQQFRDEGHFVNVS